MLKNVGAMTHALSLSKEVDTMAVVNQPICLKTFKMQVFFFKIRDELNSPTTPNLKLWTGHRGKWECVTSEIAGRMYRVIS